MKCTPNMLLVLMGLAANTILAVHVNRSLESKIAECGTIGNVMVVPEGANASDYRTCVEHPEGKPGPSVLAGEVAQSLEAQADDGCWYGANYGCSAKGSCWKRCGSDLNQGHWCWTAAGADGKGPWYTCTDASQCREDMACGQAYLTPCKTCGCKCWP